MDRRHDDKIHLAQVWWSCVVAVALAIAAISHWESPKNVLMEQDRAPAHLRAEVGREAPPPGSVNTPAVPGN